MRYYKKPKKYTEIRRRDPTQFSKMQNFAAIPKATGCVKKSYKIYFHVT